MNFVGRKDQLIQLMSLWGRGSAALVICQGRWRIGKSRLIEEFAARSECRYIKLSGLAPRRNMTNRDQLRYFGVRLSAETGMEIPEPKSWVEAFDALDRALAREKDGRILVMLDEVSWMGRYDLDFPGYLKDAWDDKLKRRPGLVLVLCGSVSSSLEELELAGFIERERGLNPATGLELKKDCYRIRDNYTRFYLRYIEPYSTMIRRAAFSFTAMAYECLTGHPPFSRGQIEYQIEHDEPQGLANDIAMGDSVMAGLSKVPDHRPGTCADTLCCVKRCASECSRVGDLGRGGAIGDWTANLHRETVEVTEGTREDTRYEDNSWLDELALGRCGFLEGY